ncbi:hypothetical protein [Spirochaeta dissipatitropha]
MLPSDSCPFSAGITVRNHRSTHKRILKPGGIAFFAYINKLTAIYYFTKNEKIINPELLKKIDRADGVVPEGFDTFLDISYFTDPQEIENEILDNGLQPIKNIGTDSVSYLIQEQLEKLPEEYWHSFIQFHLQHCEDKSSFGMSMHGLVIAKKEQSQRGVQNK